MSQHRWEQWIESKETVKLLWEARERLKTAWEWDRKDPRSYPINTSYALAQILESLSMQPRDKNTTMRLAKRKKPTSLAQLIQENVVKTVYEDHHADTLREAIRVAGEVQDWKKSWRAFQGIIRAIEMAYVAHYFGEELLPKPKVSILHRGLARIAKASGLEGQTEEGFAEFLDDLCPCGLRSHREAVRKLRSRSARNRRPKV